MIRKFITRFLYAFIVCLLFVPVSAQAASTVGEMTQFPNVSLSPDGSERAWTTDWWDKTNEMLPYGYTIDMHAEKTLRDLRPGEHYYDSPAVSSVTIGEWQVMHTPGQCIHPNMALDTFAGFTYVNTNCHSYYNNGWFAYCVDCGEKVDHMYFYGREATMKNITSMPADCIYVYQCPHCSHLEQGYHYSHVCKEISYNKYRITYRGNAPEDSAAAGYVAPTLHLYENADIYNGRQAEEIGYTDRKLRTNTYSCTGYVFKGWNTKADGSGQSFADGQEVKNLTTEENGIVRLYAMWEKCESTLALNAGGGTYQGQAVYERTQKYGTSYKVRTDRLTPPEGYLVSFVTGGGSSVGSIRTWKQFSHWEEQPGFDGIFYEEVYTFCSTDGGRDVLKAIYGNKPFQLPDCKKEDESLVGWYDDPSMNAEDYVGQPGDEIVVEEDTVLYAKWAGLTLWAEDDYESHGGVGAVDLSWEQKDGKSKYYRLYKSTDQVRWMGIYSGNDIGTDSSISENYGTDRQGSTYRIPYTGYYTLTANGAKGADYSATLTGGKGGSVSATYWLEQGDSLTVYPGSAGNGMTGGTNGNGADGGSSTSGTGRGGGAATQIYLTRNGVVTELMNAGGGGGANAGYSGGAGGTGGSNTTTRKGADGAGAGGGGKLGGASGAFIYHEHKADSCDYHSHSGNTTSGGSCYQTVTNKRVYCGESEEYEQGPCSWWWDPVYDRCIRCHGTDPNTIHYGDRCDNCGEDCAVGTHYVTKKVYSLSCEQAEGWQCGKTTETIESHKPSYGGSSYVCTEYGCKNQSINSGVNAGDGSVRIVSGDIGFMEQTHLDDVLAKDMAASAAISSYEGRLSGSNKYRISISDPEDYGTVYYHKAESYAEGSNQILATSNVTTNTLTSGIYGYRYYVDVYETGTVNGSHAITAEREIDVDMAAGKQYLHVAAVDVAGNIGPTTNIEIPPWDEAPDQKIEEEYIEEVPLRTEKIKLRESDYIYEASVDTYYVRADGNTPHMIMVTGCVDGSTTNDYQVDVLRVVSEADGLTEWFQNQVPKVDIHAGDKDFANEELVTDASGENLAYLLPISAESERTEQAARVILYQQFEIDAVNDGKQIFVHPRAKAYFENDEFFSDEVGDKNNGITLIPDGIAPTIHGLDALEAAGNLDMTAGESKSFIIRAEDNGSGLKILTVTITNQDNQLTETFTSTDGSLTITVDSYDYLFMGDFTVAAEAVDNVGNRNVMNEDSLAFTLKADLQRAREPQDGDFKAGDGGVITVTTGGYADKVIIRFPEELVTLMPDINQEYVYEWPTAVKTEVYEFNLPLETLPGSYVIEIEAWKNGEKLTTDLQLPVQTTGSIIDELRTRIQDNGV